MPSSRKPRVVESRSPVDTGGREDLRVDHSRCLRIRFSESGCRLCAAVCPRAAVDSAEILSVHPDLCGGCLLCTSECPSGALEARDDFAACLARLSRAPEPVLGCRRSAGCSHAALSCLGGLSEEHLTVLCHSLSGTLSLNLVACSDCPNGEAPARLRERLERLSRAGLLQDAAGITMVESAREIPFRGGAVDRRGFFRSLGRSLFQGAAVALSGAGEQKEQRTPYSEKRLPVRRELLNLVRSKSTELDLRIASRFDWFVSFDDCCTGCQGCVAVCPTGALGTGLPDTVPVFHQLLCTGCGLCSEFCLDGALHLSKHE